MVLHHATVYLNLLNKIIVRHIWRCNNIYNFLNMKNYKTIIEILNIQIFNTYLRIYRTLSASKA